MKDERTDLRVHLAGLEPFPPSRGEGRGSTRARTFALTALLSALVVATGIEAFVVAAAVFVAVAGLVSYAFGPREDPGLTSEVALVVTFVLGALSQSDFTLAAMSRTHQETFHVARGFDAPRSRTRPANLNGQRQL